MVGRYKDNKCVEKWGPGPMVLVLFVIGKLNLRRNLLLRGVRVVGRDDFSLS